MQTDNATPTTVGPTVNLNGTGVDDLIDQVQGALTGLDQAIGALQMACPHGRDYQTGPVTYPQAREQFQRQMAALQGVRKQLFDQLLMLADQRNAMGRNARRGLR
jgi:hypothetical protein